MARASEIISGNDSTSTEVIEKPFQHFTIVFDEKLRPSHKIETDELSRRFNVKVFEDYRNNFEERERFDKELTKLRQSLANLIQRQGCINPQSTVEEALIGLGKVAPVVIFENETLKGNNKFSTETPILNQKGMTVPAEQFFDKKRYKGYALVGIPKEKYVLVIPGSSRIIDVFLDKKEDNKAINLHLEACDHPFIFSLTLLKGSGASINLKMDPDGADILELNLFANIGKDMANKQHVEILNQQGLRQYRLRGIDKLEIIPEFLRYMISDLAYIQKMSSIRIPASKGLSFHGSEIWKINKVKTVFETGQYIMETHGIHYFTSKESVEMMLKGQKKTGKISNLNLVYQDSETILGIEMPLGQVVAQLPDMILKEADSIEEKLLKMQAYEDIEVNLFPISYSYIHYIYQNYKVK